MKLKFNVIAAAIVSSVITFSAVAQHVPVRDGSNSSRAPLPANRPNDFVRIVRLTPNDTAPMQMVFAADHLGGRQAVKNEAIAQEASRVAIQKEAALVAARADAARLASAIL
jgi:hypothetical protein